MTARPVRVKPTPADIADMFRAAEDHTDYVRASTALSEIPCAMMTDEDRAAIADAMIAATARLHRFRYGLNRNLDDAVEEELEALQAAE